MKQWLAKTVVGLLMSTLIAPLAFALPSGINLYATDTVAGYSTLLRVANAPSNEEVEVLVEKPDGGQVIVEGTTDKYGKAKIDLEGYYTKRAGQYSATARAANGGTIYGESESFRVYPDSVSSSRSTFQMDQQTAAANGNDYVELKVHLKDKYANPIGGHSVQLMSSRLTDEIVRISNNNYTDDQGMIMYHLYSRESGVSTFLAHDSTGNVTLNDRAKIAFYEPFKSDSDRGGHKVQLAQASSGPVSYLKVEDIPETVNVGQTLNFTVGAYDDDGNTATDYTGLVRFSSTDPNANLPNDYQFEAEDQGSHTFSLSLSLQTAGTQTITATDINTTDIFGETEVQVGSGGSEPPSEPGFDYQGEPDNDISGSGEFDLFTPAGGTYSTNTIPFNGEALYGQIIEIYDNGQNIGRVPAEPDGGFTFSATGLSNGDHEMWVYLLDETETIIDDSVAIDIIIDTDAPQLDHIEFDPPGGVAAGELFMIRAFTEPGLPQVAIIYNDGIFEMTEDLLVDGVYEVSLTSPIEDGEYIIDALLVDDLGNEVIYSDALRLEVVPTNTIDVGEEIIEEEPEEEEEEEIIEEEEEEEITDPGQVTGVEAIAEDGRVTLSWEEPVGPELEVTDIEVIQEIELTEEEEAGFVEEVTGLTDEELADLFGGLEDSLEESLSELEDENEDGIKDLPEEEPAEEEEEEEPIIEVEPPAEAAKIVIDHYSIYYGPDPSLLYSREDTVDNSTTWFIDGLDNDTEYFFTIVAVTDSGVESLARSEAVSATPESDEAEALFAAAQEEAQRQAELAAQAAALEAAVTTPDTGPEIFWLMMLSAVFGWGYFKRTRLEANIDYVPFQDIR